MKGVVKSFKRVTYTCVAIIVMIAVYILLGSIEFEEPYYQSFLSDLPMVDDKLNAYVYLDEAGLVGSDFINSEDSKDLKQRFSTGQIDAKFTHRVLTHYAEELTAFKFAASMPYLHYKVGDDVTEFPSYVEFMHGIRLILLEAEFFASEERPDEAADSFLLAWQFSEKLKRMNGYLISYMIGIVSQDEVLKTLQRVANLGGFKRENLSKFIEALDNVEPFSEHEFKPVMQAELRYFSDYFNALIDQPFRKRWEIYREQSSWMTEDESWYPGSKRKLQGILQAFFPKFYIHRNKTLNLMSVELAAVVEWSGVNCGDIDGLVNKEYEWFPEVTWKEIILPNQSYHTLNNHRGNFKEYLIRRCLAYSQIEATKANIALLIYEKLNGGKPADSIDALIPDILNHFPTDFMSGQSLIYSPQNQWLYSVGKNHQDDLGSPKACYYKRCHIDENCKDNPTFPMSLEVCEFSEELE